ncbi:MAG: O-sialoglycoprotein endopeptidase [Microgenomates group bacterium Gr01-1014_5]|nr:MAG: O-sialoglycoprotein endopeptidase [Microgenomates group bacterium Gr01-1014_5]
MVILGIETSCDETAASVVKDGREILSHVLATSVQMHIKTGGIIPEKAAREQVKSIIPVIEEALLQASGAGGWRLEPGSSSNLQSLISSLDCIAVTYGPGLIGSLLVGVETAKTLSYLWKKPVVPVNHLTAHIYANWLTGNPTNRNLEPELPAVALVVSGGHTDLVYLKNHGQMEYIGGTRDDAAGEAFDKTARLLGLPYPGGPAIAAAASHYPLPTTHYQSFLPRPMISNNNFDFSFSGLKTAVLREVSNFQHPSSNLPLPTSAFAYEIQEAITDVLVEKSLRAVKQYKAKTFLLAGGVAANSRLREKFELRIKNNKLGIDFRVPPPELCTDNASPIAACAEFNYHPLSWQQISANPNLSIMN